MRGRIDPHARYRELIAARLDQPLTRMELRALAAHVKKCAPCSALEAEYRAERGLLRTLQPPLPPRDLWARTSSSLDREVARAYRARTWRRRLARGTKSAQPSTSLMTAVAALGISAAVAVLQLSPAIGPAASLDERPTPLAVTPQQITLFGMGGTDVAVYRTEVSEVCPANGPQDCVETETYVRTPVDMPRDMRAGNVALSPDGNQLALVGHYVGKDVIAVVQMQQDEGNGSPDGNGDGDPPAKTNEPTQPTNGSAGGAPEKTKDPNNSLSSPAVAATAVPNDAGGTGAGQPTTPPQSAVPGLKVLAILDNVQSAGAPPDWAPNGEVLAFSAIPDDRSRGPDVYVWSPGDTKARPITTDHGSFFASWSGNRIVVSRLSANGRPRTFVVDPRTGEERPVSGPQLWLPSVNSDRSQAIGWFGQLDASGAIPTLRSGALYLMDWASVDPFNPITHPDPTAAPIDEPVPDPTATAEPTPTPTATPDATATPDLSTSADLTPEPDTDEPTATPDTSAPTSQPATAQPATAQPTSDADPDPVQQIPTPEPARSQDPDDAASGGVPPDTLVPLEPDRDPRAAPVVDWQAHWSADNAVLGVWIADSAGSSWGRLAVFAVDQNTHRVSRENPLLSMTLARRGFSLGANRVAWVGPSDDDVDGELRIRTWGSDGVGGLRLNPPESEEVVPAS